VDLTGVNWRKSTYSNGSGGDCTECASHHGKVLVRDSKAPNDEPLKFDADTWRRFIGAIKQGELG
jgi:hypothetical protein